MSTKINVKKKIAAHEIYRFGLTGAFVEFACLCNIPFAQPGSLSNGWAHSIHIVAWQDGVQKDASVIQQEIEIKGIIIPRLMNRIPQSVLF